MRLGGGVWGRALRRRVSVEGRVRGRRRVVGVNILLGWDWVSLVVFCVVYFGIEVFVVSCLIEC